MFAYGELLTHSMVGRPSIKPYKTNIKKMVVPHLEQIIQEKCDNFTTHV